jgi:hypothetical protein
VFFTPLFFLLPRVYHSNFPTFIFFILSGIQSFFFFLSSPVNFSLRTTMFRVEVLLSFWNYLFHPFFISRKTLFLRFKLLLSNNFPSFSFCVAHKIFPSNSWDVSQLLIFIFASVRPCSPTKIFDKNRHPRLYKQTVFVFIYKLIKLILEK